jgi:hypothetical protein
LVQDPATLAPRGSTHLLESLVVHKAGGILGDLELALLDLFSELPGWSEYESRDIRRDMGHKHGVAAAGTVLRDRSEFKNRLNRGIYRVCDVDEAVDGVNVSGWPGGWPKGACSTRGKVGRYLIDGTRGRFQVGGAPGWSQKNGNQSRPEENERGSR